MIGFLPPVGLRKGNKVGRIQIHQPLFFVYFCTGFNRLFHRPPQAEGKSGQHKVPYFLTGRVRQPQADGYSECRRK